MLNCRKCKHDHNKVTCEKRRRETSHCFESKPVTHFDRIKAMSVEEMAKYIYEHDDNLNDVICKTIYPECPWGDLVSPDNCLDCIKKYLESEVQEDE